LEAQFTALASNAAAQQLKLKEINTLYSNSAPIFLSFFEKMMNIAWLSFVSLFFGF
jgi:hypothetical protein